MDPDAMDQLSLEDEAWEREQGIPQLSDPFIQKYFQGRDALIAQEDKHRSDRDFRELLSPMAREACAIVSQIRYEEQQTLWTTAFEEELAEKNNADIYPGMMFSMGKETMEQTKLWQIVRRMPKGALLHAHLEAMCPQDYLFEEALKTEGVCIFTPGSLATPADRQKELIRFTFKSSSQESGSSIWNADYKPGTPVPITAAADSFPDGGRAGFVDWLKSRCSITAEESISHHQGHDAIWRKFTSTFSILNTLVYYEPIFRKFLARMFEQLMDDGVRWIDLRAAFRFEYRREGQETPEEGYEEVFRVLGEEIEKFQNTEKGKGFWGARMIWTTIRAFDNRDISESMRECIECKLAYPDLIAGFDLVGQEDLGRPLADLTPILFWFRKQCAQAGVNIPFFFHAGETLGSGTETDHNLFDAILLGTRRLGHGFSLYKHPLLMNMVKDKRILVESCPISNEILRLTASITQHPLPALLAQGVPCALCNDDPAILGQDTAGMSHDFFQTLQAYESLGLEGLGALAENSVRWAAFEDQDARAWTEDVKNGAFGKGLRAQRMKEWKKEWEVFAQWIVMEFGVDMDTEPDE